MKTMSRILRILTLAAFISATAIPVCAQEVEHPDESEYHESIRRPVRRLHPEREREKALKQAQAEYEATHRAEADVTAWDTETASKKGKGAKKRQADGKTAAEKSRLDELLNTDYSLKEYVPAAPVRPRWKDDPVTESRAQLSAGLRTDNANGHSRMLPGKASFFREDNGIFFYFENEGGILSPLRMRIQYYADDPLNFKKVHFTIDGFDYDFTPSNTSRGQAGPRRFWENNDQPLTSADKDLVYALAHATWVRMALVGDKGINHVKLLSEQDIRDFYNVLQLYRLMGGTI